MIVKDEVLTEDEGTECIMSRCMKEIEHAQHQSILKRGNPRKVLMRKLDFTAALDNLYSQFHTKNKLCWINE